MRIAMVLVVLSLTNAVRLFGQETRTPPEVRAPQSGSLVELQTLIEVEGGQLLEGRELEYPRFLSRAAAATIAAS